jgi:hypothetical protein
MKNAITEGTVLNRAVLAQGLAMIADAFTSRLMAGERNTSINEGGSAEKSGGSATSLTRRRCASKSVRAW